MLKYNTESGSPDPLGASCNGEGTNFALFSEHAEKVELLIFEPKNVNSPACVIQVKDRTDNIRHCYVHGVTFGHLYAYRVHGQFEPEKGYRFNPSKVVLDPYARAISGILKWDDYLLGYRTDDYYQDLSYSDRDSCPCLPKCVIVDPSFDWEKDRRPEIPWNETVIYETHVKGISALHPGVPEKKRGTFAGLASPEIIKYMNDLGITAVELLPVHQSMDERALYKKHFTNYWGYNTIGFFAPDARYSSSGFMGGQVREFKEMVKALHRAGIEVIIDAVYNHTAESDELGPTICFRGIDNLSYYQLDPENPRKYLNYTGCGNSMNVSHPAVKRLIMDSLRYWVDEMHVDGFRFDLAVTLARGKDGIDSELSFFKEVSRDPVLSKVKLIAEPWDIGERGYLLGKFPPQWSEWNDKYRDTLRRFWKSDNIKISEISHRITGSGDIFGQNRQSPAAGINYITAHDGFTLNDLVSYNNKHNIFNKESDKDGTNDNFSWNSGEEGISENPEIDELRERRKRNFIATLLLSQGIPMLLHGDEIGRTQRGNNNAYCQDNRITWLDWDLDEKKRGLLEFTKSVIKLRSGNPVFRRASFFAGQKTSSSNLKDIIWIKPDSGEINDYEWNNSSFQALGVFLNGEAADGEGKTAGVGKSSSFLFFFNACLGNINFIIPGMGQKWELILYTFDIGKTEPRILGRGENFLMAGHSLAVFRMI